MTAFAGLGAPRWTAVHEAGHVAAALRLGWAASVDVLPGTVKRGALTFETGGQCYPRHVAVAPATVEAKLRIVLSAAAISAAGSLAERRFSDSPVPRCQSGKIDNLDISVIAFLALPHEDDRPALIAWADCAAEVLLDGTAPLIAALAAALLERGRLSEAEVAAIASRFHVRPVGPELPCSQLLEPLRFISADHRSAA